jgi:galactokinase
VTALSGERGEVIRRAGGLHQATYGGLPAWVFVAPGRVNLIGEHTDYNDGLVLPMAIDRVCVAAASPGRVRGMHRVVSEAADGEAHIPADRPVSAEEARRALPRWATYAAGVIGAVGARAGGVVRALDIAVASSVPEGAGLASSAALEVAVYGVAGAAAGVEASPVDVARDCRRAEHEFAGVPCGIMDQMVSVLGRRGHAVLIDCRDEAWRPVPLPRGAVVVVMNTGVRHALADGEYARRREACRRAAQAMGLGSLRAARVENLDRCGARLDENERRCAAHVIGEVARTASAAALLDALAEGRVGREEALWRLGALMGESHASLRDDYRVSCPELDAVVEAAARVGGVYGARMTGAGFGGCAIALAEPSAVAGIAAEVGAAFHRRFGRSCDVFAVEAGDGAGEVGPGGWRADVQDPCG